MSGRKLPMYQVIRMDMFVKPKTHRKTFVSSSGDRHMSWGGILLLSDKMKYPLSCIVYLSPAICVIRHQKEFLISSPKDTSKKLKNLIPTSKPIADNRDMREQFDQAIECDPKT